MRVLRVGVIALVVVGCVDDSPSGPRVEAPGERHAIVQEGNGHFFFLSPIVGGTQTFTGVFNPDLAPVVEVCALPGTPPADLPDENTACGAVVATYSLVPDAQGTAITVSLADEWYHVSWQLKNNPQPDGYYRISVKTARGNAGTTLGFADVVVQANASSLTQYDKDLYVRHVNGQNLPVKFRIEYGALCEVEGCFEGKIDDDGGTFTNDDATAGVYVPPGAVGDDPINLVIERYTDGACLPTDFPQYEGCYRFYTEPAGFEFNELVTVGVCMDPRIWDDEHPSFTYDYSEQMELWKWDEDDVNTLQALNLVAVDFLDCEQFMAVAAAASPYGAFASAAGRILGPLARLVGPKQLYAKTGPSITGGTLDSFSRIGWVRPLEVAITAGDGQTGLTEDPLPTAPRVRVTSRRQPTQGVGGVPVQFLSAPSGYAAPAEPVTDANGYASTEWILGADPGAYTLEARPGNYRANGLQYTCGLSTPCPPFLAVPGSKPPVPSTIRAIFGSVTFTATAVDPSYDVIFLPPVGTGSTGPGFIGGLKPVVDICQLAGSGGMGVTTAGCVAGTLVTLATSQKTDYYQANWKTKGLPAEVDFGIWVRLGTEFIGFTKMTSKTTSGGFGYFEPNSTVSIKFSVE
jgi:hypothetical protein